ncbi:MAG: PfkB family carbohydrate kinase [Cyclobacteriaceae bacterium]
MNAKKTNVHVDDLPKGKRRLFGEGHWGYSISNVMKLFFAKRSTFTLMKPSFCICFGEVLWDILPHAKIPGGAPMNVALHLANLGVDVAMVSRVGEDELGQELRRFLHQRQFSDQWIQSEKNLPTGTVRVDVSDRNNVRYEIVHPVAWDNIQFLEEMNLLTPASAIVFGSLACRSMASQQTLLKLLETINGIKIFDVNLRSPRYSKDFVIALMAHANILKINEDELDIISSWLNANHLSIEEKLQAIKSNFEFDFHSLDTWSRGSNVSKSEWYFLLEEIHCRSSRHGWEWRRIPGGFCNELDAQ